jgi:hypothetical protein
VEDADIQAPAIVVIGEIVRQRATLESLLAQKASDEPD